MELNAYLSFNGQCEEAFKFYEKCLGGKITFMMVWGDSPMAKETPPGWGKKIMHVTLAVGKGVLQGADTTAEHYQKPHGFCLSLSTTDVAEAERVFHALAENATVQMPLAETFWALRFGMLTDQYGTPWMVNCEKPAGAPQ